MNRATMQAKKCGSTVGKIAMVLAVASVFVGLSMGPARSGERREREGERREERDWREHRRRPRWVRPYVYPAPRYIYAPPPVFYAPPPPSPGISLFFPFHFR
jgi:hypothetical protein